MNRFYHTLAFMALAVAGMSAQDQLYAVGEANSWGDGNGPNIENAPVLKQTGVAQTYQGLIPGNFVSQSFRFYTEKNWKSGYGPGDGTDQVIDCTYPTGISITKGDGKFKFAENTPELLFSVDMTNSVATVSALPTEIYMNGGSANSTWSWDNVVTFTSAGNGVYTATMKAGTLAKSGDNGLRFYFAKNDWSAITVAPAKAVNNVSITVPASGETVTAPAIIYKGESGKYAFDVADSEMEVNVTVDLANATLKIEKVQTSYEIPANLYLVGDLDLVGWQPNQALPLTNEGNGIFTIKKAALYNAGNAAHFQLLTQMNWSADRYLPQTSDFMMSPENPATMAVWHNGGGNENNYNIANGLYDITVDFNTNKVSVTRVEENHELMAFKVNTSFWEGPINEALKPENGGNASNIPFEFVEKRDNGVYVYKIKVADNIDPIEYVSQLWMGGYLTYYKYSYDNGVFNRTRISTNADGKDTDFRNLYFDAHSTDALVPVTTEFWCDNSRMEVGLTVKAIYLGVYLNEDFNRDAGQTPFKILLSSTGDIDIDNAKAQRPFNSKKYAISLTSGTLYEALKGTRTGKIAVPFSRHAPAEDAYVINLGKSVTLSRDERFELLVDGKSANKSFSISQANAFTQPTDGPVSTIGEDLTFNQIILYAEGDNYDQFKIWLRNGTTKDSAPADYNEHYRNPMLKVWQNSDASWDALFSSEVKESYAEGSVKYYEFEPVVKGDIKTNLYYLDLPQGVKIHRAGYGQDNNHYDQFNIIDQDGYDVSNPYQGSQFIYPETWWCANPNLLARNDEEAVRSYQGHSFRAIPEFPSRVDLAWNLADNEGDQNGEVTIYGITLFKIIGNVYDIYSENEAETNLYYVYAHTSPRTGDLRAKCEQTAPIMLRVKGATEDGKISETTDGALVKYEPKYAAAYQKFNDPGLKAENGNFLLKLSSEALVYNTDLNYILDGIDLNPKSKTDLEFVAVNGQQRWAAAGADDELRANKWSNYYAGDFHAENALNINAPELKYYKVVLATNPDQVRYQIMSKDMTINTDSKLLYQSTNDPEYDEKNELIYPVTDVSTILTWQDGYEIEVELTFTDKEGNTQTKTFTIDKKPEGSDLADADGFYEDGQVPFEADLGKYVVGPDVTITATATYKPTESGKETQKLESKNSTKTDPLPVPELKNLTAEPDIEKQKWYQGKYTSDLSWETDDNDYPHHYEFTQMEQGSGKEPEAIDGDCHYIHDTKIDDVDIEGTKIDKNNHNEVNIDYSGIAKYHFAVPENGLFTVLAGEPDYSTPGEGMKVETTKSEPGEATAKFTYESVTGLENIYADDSEVEYYNLQGIRVCNPSTGVYIRRQGNTSTKVMIP